MSQIEGISVETLMLANKYTDEHGGGGGGATDAGSVSYDETKTYKEGTVGAELTAQKNAIDQLTVYGTASGDIAKFHAISEMQIKKVVGTIVPQQSDSGDVRPITGWTDADITSVNNILPNKRVQYNANIIFLGVDSGTTAEELSIWLDAGTYVLRVNTIGTATIRYGIIGYVSDAILGNTNTDLTFTVPARAQCRFWTTYISTNNIKDFWLSLASEKTVLSIDWQSIAGTIYGGSVTLNEDGSSDVLSTMGNIASYAGETLPGKWISSMDEYEEGATPTTGAQVVYELAEPLSYHFDNVGKLYTHDAEDWVWISTGAIEEADYPAGTQEYIDTSISELSEIVNGFDGIVLKNDPVANFRVGGINLGTLTDMNTAEDNVLYMIQVTNKTSIANLPDAMPADGLAWLSVSHKYTNRIYGSSIFQYVFKNDLSTIFKRQRNEDGTWGAWATVYQKQATDRGTVVVDINGHGDFTKFTDGIAYAYAQGDTDVYVKNGTYDITSEIDLETAGAGPVIGKGMRLFFESNAVIQCYYTGSSEAVKSTFSPLNAANDKGFEIHNMKIRCKNTRYCVHDEHGVGGIPYVNKYINCDMYLDNSESSWVAPQCIGGGLGNCGIIEIDGGYYEGTAAPGDNYYGEISYHNTSVANSISQIFIKNVYCKNNTVRFGYYGASTMITKCFVNGCSFAVAPRVRAETESSQNVNMEMIAWGNEVRTT